MGFLRLLKGELNKLLMRPLLYVLTIVLVFGIFASFLMFNPDQRKDIAIADYDNCSTVSEAYMIFNNATSSHGKEKTNDVMQKAKQMKTSLEEINEDESLNNLKQKVSNLKNSVNIYFDDYGSLADDEAKPAEKEAFHNLENNLSDLKTYFSDIFNKNIIPIIATSSLYQNFSSLLTATQSELKNVTITKHSSHENFRKFLTETNFSNNLDSDCKQFLSKTYSQSDLENLTEKIEKTENYLLDLNLQIEEKHTQETNLDEFIKLVKKYNLAAVNLYNLVDNTKKYSPYLKFDDQTINSFYEFSEDKSIFSYKIREQMTKQSYLINNDATLLDYSNVFAQNQNSSAQKNAFDLVFFGLEITSFIIIIFTVVLVAGTIAGEQSNGTLKLLLIRPYSRSKILTSKLLASLIFASIFLVFTALIFFLIGMFVFGVDFSPVLAVFNAGLAFTIHPVALLLIYILCLLVKVFIYVLIALAISSIFKSNVAAVGISIVLYIILSILSVTLSGSFWYGFMPFSNFDLFKFFGGSFLSTSGTSAISILFSAPIFHGVSFWFAFVSDLILATIIAFCSYWVFAKREIK